LMLCFPSKLEISSDLRKILRLDYYYFLPA